MKYSVLLILLLVLSSCASIPERKDEYPEVIEKFHLEEKHDLAKWEVYKNNTLNIYDQNQYFLNFRNDSIANLVDSTIRNAYIHNRIKIPLKPETLIEILGEENVKRMYEMELELFPQDSADIFVEDEIHLSFFPVKNEEEYWQSLDGLCYAVIFKDDIVTRMGCNDYTEFDYTIKASEDQSYIQLLTSGKDVNNWLKHYIKENATRLTNN